MDITKIETKKTETLKNDFLKSLTKFKMSSGETALYLFIYLSRFENRKERSEAVKDIMNETGLGKSSISQLNKAGEYIYNNPDCLNLGSTACYKLAKSEEATEETTEEVTEEITEEEEKEEEEEEEEEKTAEIDLISITLECDVWHDIYTALAKSKNENVQILRQFIKNSLGL